MNVNLHNTDTNSVEVKSFKKDKAEIFSRDFVAVSVKDRNNNEITLYVDSLADVLNLGLLLQEKSRKEMNKR